MKIGILTFHCTHNYGAVLQAYALQKHLSSLGHTALIVDYCPQYLLTWYQKFYWRYWVAKSPSLCCRKIAFEISNIITRKKRFKAFDDFITRKLNLYAFNPMKKQDFDAYVFGSDQIWSPKICRNFDPIYFADFPAAKKKRCISYAASMGKSTLSIDEKTFLRSKLENFTAISVREESLNQLLSPISSKRIQTVLDPTLLVNKIYLEVLASTKIPTNKYILIYQVVRNPDIYQIALKIAQEQNAQIIELASGIDIGYSQQPWLKLKFDSSPEEFVDYIKNAHCVVTSSFHGTALSIIFNKTFYTLKLNSHVDLRSHTLLTNLNLTERFITAEEYNAYSTIDYTEANVLLEKQKEESNKFLLNALSQ